ncbi:hypothetical protein HZC34_01860 [Candidatus Saganbacteria bacterium]|nr:hypothetical protein [Candidatus Saganbacteria bacterium]
MSSIFDDPYGYSIGLVKPIEFPSMDLPDTQKIFLHEGETTTAFKWVASRINNLMKMSKFMPDYMSKLFGGVEITKEDLTQFGQAYTDPQEAVHKVTNDNGTPWDGHHGYNDDIFGYTHNLLDPQGNQWGAGSGIFGSKNLNYNPGAAEQVLLKDKSSDMSFNDTWMDDPNLFRQAINYNPSGQLINGAPDETFGDYRSYLNNASDLLASFGGKSYYEIVMSGMNSTNIAYVDDPNSDDPNDLMIDYGQTAFGYFDYDNLTPYQSFLLATGIVRDRRAIFATMSEIFGSFRYIYNGGSANGPNDQAMINTMNSWINDPNKGKYADKTSLAWFDSAFKAQHYLHTLLPAYSGGENWSLNVNISNKTPSLGDGGEAQGENGGTRDAQDQVAFKRFRAKIRTGAQAYINSLPSEDNEDTDINEKAVRNNAQQLFDEFTFDGYDLPYGSFDAFDPKVGWDFYSMPWWHKGQEKYQNVNPNATGHAFYAIAQFENLESVPNAKGLKQNNWVLNELGRLAEFKTASDAKISNTIFMNMLNSRVYRRQTITYKNKKEEIAELIAEIRRAEGKANAKAIARYSSGRKLAAAKQSTQTAKIKKESLGKTTSKKDRNVRQNQKTASNIISKKPYSGNKKS